MPDRAAPLKFSCITTVFNEGELVRRSIESVLGQSHSDLELIIVDDGSDDETRLILESIRDPRITLIRQANCGLSAARNKAMEQVTGDYVCFLDADDCRPPWALRALAEIIERDEPDLVLSRGSVSEANERLLPFYDTPKIRGLAKRLDSGPAVRGSELDPTLIPMMHLIEPQVANKTVRADFMRRAGLWFPSGHFFEDIYFHTIAIGQAQRISVLDALCFTYFHRHRPQVTNTHGETRFDIIGVTRLTLEMFSRLRGFRDPLQRAAAMASCAILVRWCEDMISHQHRSAYRDLAKTLFRNVDADYLRLPSSVPSDLEEIAKAGDYLSALGILEDVPPKLRPEGANLERHPTRRLLGRLWRARQP